MDFYYSPEWRAAHPEVSALFDKLCPTDNPRDWRVLFQQREGMTYCLARGHMGDPSGFVLAWSRNPHLVTAFLYEKDVDFVAHWQLSTLIEDARKAGIDVLSFPLKAWKEQRP